MCPITFKFKSIASGYNYQTLTLILCLFLSLCCTTLSCCRFMSSSMLWMASMISLWDTHTNAHKLLSSAYCLKHSSAAVTACLKRWSNDCIPLGSCVCECACMCVSAFAHTFVYGSDKRTTLEEFVVVFFLFTVCLCVVFPLCRSFCTCFFHLAPAVKMPPHFRCNVQLSGHMFTQCMLK